MDVYCKFCNEPVDVYEFHDIAEEQEVTYDDVYAAFRTSGCEALGSKHNGSAIDRERAMKLDALYDLLGDDVDGAASMIDDFEYVGLL